MASKCKRYCSVPQCKNYKSVAVSIHMFPKDPVLSEKWRIALRIDKPITKGMSVCSEHFLPYDFHPLSFYSSKRCLKTGVVPSQKIPVIIHDHHPYSWISFRRAQKRCEKRKLHAKTTEDMAVKVENTRDAEEATELNNHEVGKSEEAFMETQLHPVDLDVKDEDTTLTNYQNFEAVFIKEEPLEEDPSDGQPYKNILQSIKSEECITDNESDKESENLVTENNIIGETGNTNSKRFNCEVCYRSFILKGNLTKHIQSHNGVKEFLCPVCKKVFTQNCRLKNHMKTHAGIKEHQCPTCNKAFTYNWNLKTHMKMHTGVKEYKCTVCNKLFTFNSALYNHMKIHTRTKEEH